MEMFPWLLIIAGIACALCSDKISAVIKENETLQKVLLVFFVGVLFVCVITIFTRILS